jgi:hypothetical protein
VVKTDLLADSPNDLDAVFVQNFACSRNILEKPKAREADAAYLHAMRDDFPGRSAAVTPHWSTGSLKDL